MPAGPPSRCDALSAAARARDRVPRCATQPFSKGRARQRGRASSCSTIAFLVEFRVDVAEGVAEFAAETLHDRDDRYGDACGDQAIFDGRRAVFVTQEALKQCAHVITL